jgi:hypothetical protein
VLILLIELLTLIKATNMANLLRKDILRDCC